MRIRFAPSDRRMRWLAAAWILLFAVDVLISAPVCKRFQPAMVHRAVVAGTAPAGAAQPGAGGHAKVAASHPSNPTRHHGHSHAAGSDQGCDFCLLTGLANMALPWLLAPRLTVVAAVFPAPVVSPRSTRPQRLSIRAPPAA